MRARGRSQRREHDGLHGARRVANGHTAGSNRSRRGGLPDPGKADERGASSAPVLLRERTEGPSGVSNDVRELEASANPRARFALDYFVYRAALQTGLLAAALGGLDAFVFTAGIGENSACMRAAIVQRLAWLGGVLDPVANAAGGTSIAAPESRIAILVVPTDEELMIARHTLALLAERYDSSRSEINGNKGATSMAENKADPFSELPTAKDLMKQVALKEAEKASDYVRKQAAAEAEKKALMDRLAKPSGVSDEERMKRAAAIIKRAVDNGLTEVQVGRFPNTLCTDRGRAINQMEPGWENTLTGLPKEIFQFWQKHLQSRGYKIRFQIVDFPDGMPGDIGITLSWH